MPDMEATVILFAPPAVAPPASTVAADEPVAFNEQTAPVTPSPVIDFVLEEADPASFVEETPVAARPVTPAAPKPAPGKNVEPTLQLAEIMLSMGLEQGAAKALVEYVEAHPGEAVYHWLKLLGIYRDGGHHRDFEETAAKLRRHFNIQAQESPSPDRTGVPTLESFPRLAQQVQKIWPRPDECIAYLQHLLKDNREGERMGFPQSVAEEILLLIEVLKGTSGATQSVGL